VTTGTFPRCACLGRGSRELRAGEPVETCPLCSGVRPMLLVDPKLEVRLLAVRNYAHETAGDEGLGPELRALARFMATKAVELDLLRSRCAGLATARLRELDLGLATFRILLRDGLDDEQHRELDALARRFLDVSLEDFRARGGGA